MTTLAVELSENVFAAVRFEPDEFLREMRLAAAMFWYEKRLRFERKGGR